MNNLQYINYSANYVEDAPSFYKAVVDRTVKPHQVEFQPGSSSSQICWMKCPHCYGINTQNTDRRLSTNRLLEIIDEVSSVPKIIFSGYATDPLFYKDCHYLFKKVVEQSQIIGIHSKFLKVSDKVLEALWGAQPESYVSVSLDAYNDVTYSTVHNFPQRAYDKVLANIKKLADTGIHVNVNYLITHTNNHLSGMLSMYDDCMKAGATAVRYSVAQHPKFATYSTAPVDEVQFKVLQALDHAVVYDEYRDERQAVPCWARWLYPTISFDGHLARCSETSSPTWDSIRLGDLADRSFWDLYYDYSSNDTDKIAQANCMCDRKLAITNERINQQLGYEL